MLGHMKAVASVHEVSDLLVLFGLTIAASHDCLHCPQSQNTSTCAMAWTETGDRAGTVSRH